MIKQVRSFQTSDGGLFETKEEAVKHEFKLEMQQIFKQCMPVQVSMATPQQIATMFIKQADYAYEVMRKYRESLRRIPKVTSTIP